MIDDLAETTKNLSETFRDGMALLKNLLDEPTKALGDTWADKIRIRRFIQQVSTADRAVKVLEERGLTASRIPALNFLLPLLDGAGNAEEPELQELWAQLLANAVSSDDYQSPLFADRLKQMSGQEAKLLQGIAAHAFPGSSSPAIDPNVLVRLSRSLSSKALDRLVALGILSYGYKSDRLGLETNMFMTPFGFQLCGALSLEVAQVVWNAKEADLSGRPGTLG